MTSAMSPARLLSGAELCHRAKVAQFELRRTLGANAEEGFVELRLDDASSSSAIRSAIGRLFRRKIPDDLSVLLQEVGVALGVRDDDVDRARLVCHSELGGRLGERGLGLGR